jgi:hypothetical protein
MIKIPLGLIFICILPSLALTTIRAQEKKVYPVSAKRSPDGYILSINAINLPLGELLEKLSRQCPLKIVTYEKDSVSQPITMSLKEVPLEQGIKLLLKAAGLKNYFISYANEENHRSSIAVVTLLANGTKTNGKTVAEGFIKTREETKGMTSNRETLIPEDEFAERITTFKERYEWADEGTKELAGYLLKCMPKPARNLGVEALKNELDREIAVKGNDTVDENIFFQALENTVPSHVAPVMMESINHYSQRYKTGILHETDEQISNELYQEIMNKRFSNSTNNQKGDPSYGYEND